MGYFNRRVQCEDLSIWKIVKWNELFQKSIFYIKTLYFPLYSSKYDFCRVNVVLVAQFAKKRGIARREPKREARTQKERCTVALVPRTTTVLLPVHSNRVTIIKLAKLVLAPREYSWRDVPADRSLLRDKEIRGTSASLITYLPCMILRRIVSINEQLVRNYVYFPNMM